MSGASLHDEPGGELPRLLYVGDVPVTDSAAGAALLFRLLRSYPAERLCLVGPIIPGMNRLPGVAYHHFGARFQRLLRTRLSGLYCTWITWRYHRLPRSVRRVAERFRPQAVLSVSQTGGWVIAWRLAARHAIPFHLLVHDDHAYAAYLPARFRSWAERHFAAAYRSASWRYCISPAMAEVYEQRYGVQGRVMYPTRDPANPVFPEPAPRIMVVKSALKFAYAGSIHGESNLQQVLAFAEVARARGHQLLVYSPQHKELTLLARAKGVAADVRAPLPSAELLRRLRSEADCLLVTGSFDPQQRTAVTTLFPSKLADYSATGLPLITWAPEYASITRFVRENAGVAELVTEAEPTATAAAMDRIASSAEYRWRLADTLIAVGRRCFSPESAWEMFSSALRADRSAARWPPELIP